VSDREILVYDSAHDYPDLLVPLPDRIVTVLDDRDERVAEMTVEALRRTVGERYAAGIGSDRSLSIHEESSESGYTGRFDGPQFWRGLRVTRRASRYERGPIRTPAVRNFKSENATKPGT
jgi:hypothetical protein